MSEEARNVTSKQGGALAKISGPLSGLIGLPSRLSKGAHSGEVIL